MESNCPNTIALLDSVRHRADCLALALQKTTIYDAVVFTRPDVAELVHFAVILIDIGMGLDAALRLTRLIITRQAQAKIILLGLVESKENVIRAAEEGVSGHVSPEDSLDQLVSLLGAVQRGEFICSPRANYYLFSHLASLCHRSYSDALPKKLLTARELEVLDLLSRRLSNKEIAAQLCVSPLTVKNHIHRILTKMSVRNRRDASAARWTKLMDELNNPGPAH